MLLTQILDRLEHHAARLIFVSDKGVETARTFHDLHRDAVALVRQLEQAGIAPGARIGILAPNCYAWMVWDLAIMAARCTSVAFAQEKPADSIAQLVDRHALNLIAVDPDLVPSDALQADHVVSIHAASLPAGTRSLKQRPVSHPYGTHSLVFSSGTTGKTKGLIISAPGTERLLDLYEQAFGVQDGDRLLTFLPFANYQQRMAYYFCLYHGIDFVCVPFPQLFLGLKKYKPTYVIAPPIFYEAVQNMAQAAVGSKSGAAAEVVDTATRVAALLGGNMRYMITGMAPIKRHTLDFFWNNGISLFEAFGITEAGMVAWNKPGAVKIGTVGKPAEAGSVTLTEEGEVVITRDALLSLGYFEATEEDVRATFVSANSVATGDIAEFSEDGFLTILGRKKDAIITRAGEKFHPEPIEALIQLEPKVKVAVVLGGDDIPGITAIVSLQAANDTGAEAQIRQHVAQINQSLPTCQQVKRVVFTLHEFSIDNGLRTKNLKLNRKAILKAFLDNRLVADHHAHETAA